MTSAVLKQLERKFGRAQVTAPLPAAGGLGEAIERLLQAEVEKQVAEQMQHHQSPRARRILDGMNRPPVERWHPEPVPASATPAPRQIPPVTVSRDEFRRIRTISIGQQQMLIQRGSDGMIVGMVPLDDAGETRYDGAPVRQSGE